MTIVLALTALSVAACETTSGSRGPERAPSAPPSIARSNVPAPASVASRIEMREPATPGHLQGRGDLVRAALLLPFSSPSPQVRAEANSMLDAAQLALFETGADTLVLIPKDTGGTPEGAQGVARDAISEGADIILGPFFSAGVIPVAEIAASQGVPVISFSNDLTAAGAGAYLIDIPLEQEIERIITFASQELAALKAEEQFTVPNPAGVNFESYSPYAPLPTTSQAVSFAVIAPDNPYGHRVRQASEVLAPNANAFLSTYEFYLPSAESDALSPIARRLARYDERSAILGANPEAVFELPYDAVILPEGGVRLLSLAPLLPYYDVDPRQVQFLGTSLWNDPNIAREPALAGGWFPAADPAARAAYTQRFAAAFSAQPGRLSGLAYDAVALVGQLTRNVGASGLTKEAIERPEGFLGAEGLFRFRPDGTSERALAVLQVQNGGFVVIDPAPTTFATF